ncbi:hypothetical protein HDV01_000962 [Terramyces sp. JEL0728]|nr:hypothetical protein HDV01_000962 [Terramyces sp. JEL0728]
MATRSAKKASASRISSAEAPKTSIIVPLPPQESTDRTEQNATEAPTREIVEKSVEEMEEEEFDDLVNVFQKRVDLLPFSMDLLKQGLSEIGPSPDHLKSVYHKLSLPFRSLVDISGLSEFAYLFTLELRGNKIKVDLSDNDLSDSIVFEPAPFNLQDVNLSQNHILDIGDMSIHRFLTRLAFDECCNLKYLTFARNRVQNIAPLAGLPLKYLNIQSNDIECIEIAKSLTKLQELYASSNKIQNISCLAAHPHLNLLDLESNLIDDAEMVSQLSTLPLLRNLKITLNPIQDTLKIHPDTESDFPIHNNAYYPLSFRLKTIFLIPRLTVLNAIPVTPEEKVAAVNIYDPPTAVKISKQHQHQTKQQALAYARIKAEDLMRVKRLRPIVLCGPSGSGKRTLAARLLRDHPHIYGLSISHTTRKPRPGEEHGVHYWFVSKKEMLQMNQEGKFIEMVTLFGNMYGTSMESIDRVTEQGKICILVLEYEGMIAIQKSSLKPRYIMVTTSSIHILEQRLAKRVGYNENDHQQWVTKAKEAQNYEGVDHVIVNDDLEKAVAGLESYCLDLYWKEFDQDD